MKFKNTLLLLQILLQLADLKAIKVEIGDTSTPQVVSRQQEKEEPIAWDEVDEVKTLHEESSSIDRGETIFSIRNNNNDGKVVGKKKRGQREASNSSTSSDDSSNVFFGSGKSL